MIVGNTSYRRTAPVLKYIVWVDLSCLLQCILGIMSDCSADRGGYTALVDTAVSARITFVFFRIRGGNSLLGYPAPARYGALFNDRFGCAGHRCHVAK